MNQMLPEPVRPGFIDCYAGEFPASDPQAATAYSQVLMSAFEFEIPLGASEAFAASTELFFLPDVTLSWA